MARNLRKIKAFHPPEAFIPPAGSVPAGVITGPDGSQVQLWRLKRGRSKSVPDFEPTPDAVKREAELKRQGKNLEEIGQIMLDEGFPRRFKRNQVTGNAVYPHNRPYVYDEDFEFYMVSEGNGNGRMERYVRPTDAELAEREREKQIALVRDELPRLIVDRGLSVDDVVSRLTAPEGATVPATVDDGDDTPGENEEYPVHLGFGRWRLSDGSEYQGKKDEAVEAEAAVSERMADVQAQSAMVPEV